MPTKVLAAPSPVTTVLGFATSSHHHTSQSLQKPNICLCRSQRHVDQPLPVGEQGAEFLAGDAAQIHEPLLSHTDSTAYLDGTLAHRLPTFDDIKRDKMRWVLRARR